MLADPSWSHVGGHHPPGEAASRRYRPADDDPLPFGPGFTADGTPRMETDAQRFLREAAERAQRQLEVEAEAERRRVDAMTTREKARHFLSGGPAVSW